MSNEPAPIVTEKHVVGSPDLVVEILSPGTRRRDEGVKLGLYERPDVLTTPLIPGFAAPLVELFAVPMGG